MRVVIYVEGSSDKLAMEALLAPLIAEKATEGISIEFFRAKAGDAKQFLLLTIPVTSVNILLNNPNIVVVAIPDLYRKNKGFPHETFAELKKGTIDKFHETLQSRGLGDDPRLTERFQVFCFKYELETLILAAEAQLKTFLGVNSFKVTWQLPVEDENHDLPPKQVVKRLFASCGRSYKEAVDAANILRNASYQDIAVHCPQCFGPFVEFLSGLANV
ncbi:MAG: DUF4276 family protein [Hormoscilla sp. SP12CHS1]|nr:DUF4276 family protein [Hormoscilla sp. SP12CHS1]